MADLEINMSVDWDATLSIWWALAWRIVLGSALLGGVLGGIGGLILGIQGRGDLARPFGQLLGNLAQIPVSMVVLRYVLKKQFRDFSIRLVARSNEPATSNPCLERSSARRRPSAYRPGDRGQRDHC